jgi:hypothetical protein
VVDMTFEADATVAQRFAECADELVDVARDTHHITLDFSDASVELVEEIADRYFRTRPIAPPDLAAFDQMLRGIANDIGGYVGEVFRRNHGAAWGIVSDSETGDKIPGLQTSRGALFWPTGRARNRLTNGGEDNIWHYYLMLIDDEVAEPTDEIVRPSGLRTRILRSLR